MKRVDVKMSNTFRGRVSDYAKEADKSMPQAYRDLIEIGLAIEAKDPEFVRDALGKEIGGGNHSVQIGDTTIEINPESGE